MYLAEADAALLAREDRPAPQALPSDRWESFPFSRLSHHGAACCETAREWVLGMDFAQLNGADLASGPRWLRVKYKWGPSPWPMHWCEVVKRKTIDCGAHAALSQAVFAARGLTAFPAQLVQRYSADATDDWRRSWSREDVSCHWLDGEHIYHEATALLVDADVLKIWDASAGTWLNPRQGSGYGSVSALRVFADPAGALRWGERRISANVWNQLG
jgi:hypothetical protein